MSEAPTVWPDDDDRPKLHLVIPSTRAHPDPDTATDAETRPVGPVIEGVPVDIDDRPAERLDVPLTTAWADVTSGNVRPRTPIIPAWLRGSQRRQVARAIGNLAGYTLAFHATRSPKYAAKVAVYAPVGAVRVVGRLLHWATAEEGNWRLRQNAATTNDAHTWQALNRTRSREARGRWWALAAGVVAAIVGLFVLRGTGFVTPPMAWAALAALVLVLARVGRPADRPITDRVANGPRFTKLTAEMVRAAFTSLGFSVMKEPGSISFVHPGIHRDGPGWLARVNLPAGLEAVKVLERRGALSSALRLPVDQVWPSPGPEHAGQVDLWVGYQPSSKMGKPRWGLDSPTARTSYFELEEFGTDERQRAVCTQLAFQNFLIGGRPGSGKSFAGRAIVTIGMLDPTVEIKIVEYKGTGDFLDLAPICSTYACGLSDEDFATGLAILNWGLAEAERRGKRIKEAYLRGEAPERKVTPELARKPGSGLHPILIVIDEAHELFGDSVVGADAASAAERLAKRGRALGITLVIITQIPDKDSLPTGITRNIGIRWCLAVPDQVANDMILGTGAYKRGITGTVYRPVVDAGWGVLTGLTEPTAVRGHYPDPEATARIVARATALRGGLRVGAADEQLAAARDLLADMLAVAGRNGQHWAPAASALTERWPDAYPAMTPEALSELARARGVASVDVKISGRNLKGYKVTDVRALIAARDAADGTDGH
ncbi:FtsK/SpoIIIE domain-containing protein [Asanoa iriomotensis]|uniref:FtsK/SpoIIIE domain-containing protein n=1 Tax=Asanoa iriomotensis TaxID=234613 RepID=UPI0019451A8B|nr:FtsK/SpoIIIE domain-containing protein [Asanoa iriomotensis]